ncbi:MAG TPA: FTR1 family protein [Pseudomonadales bacterium]|nr:FTR1 family protein [Pseudomonadales bacterium]
MLATAIIVFREILEAALIIGIVGAATRGVARRTLWIVLGVLAGTIGAVIVAGLAEVIVGLADGMGQELFNALILLAAVSMLAWHNIWMASHSRELAAQMKQVGSAVKEGGEPMFALLLVVALAVLREGSEVVLFLYGQAAQGVGIPTMASGGAAGLLAGLSVGVAMYFGLLRIPTKHLFTVTGWMILLLAAGMASQAANFLVQADMLPAWGRLWDISAILANQSILGSLLHTLVGYDAAPVGMQLFVYVITITLIGVAMKAVNQSPKTDGVTLASVTKVAAAVAILPLLISGAHDANAGPASKVYTLNIEQGEIELELLGGAYNDSNEEVDGERGGKLEIGYGITEWWSSEVEFEWLKPANEGTGYDATAWTNVFRFTEPGQYWVDIGWYAEFAFPDAHEEAKALETGPMFQKEIGRTVNNLNLIWVRDFGSQADHDTEFEYTWQTRIKGNPLLEFGVQGMGELGDWDDTNPGHDQEHKLGPAIFGEYKLNHSKIKYDAAILVGVTDDTPDETLRFALEYEM